MAHPAWRSPPSAIRLRIAAATSAEPFRVPAFTILDSLQRFRPEVQIDSLFVLAVAMAEAVGLDSHDMVSRAKRILPEAEGPFTEQLQAARDYAQGELRK